MRTIGYQITEALRMVPGVSETYWWLRGYHSRHDTQWRRWQSWVSELDCYLNGRPEPPKLRRVLVFAIGYLSDLSLATSIVLAGNDCTVDFVYLPYSFTSHVEAARELRYIRWTMRRPNQVINHRRLRTHNLLGYPIKAVSQEMQAAASAQAMLDMQYLCQRDDVSPTNNDEARVIYDSRLQRNLDCMGYLSSFAQDRQFDMLLVPNGGIFEFGACYQWGRTLGLPMVSFEYADRLNHIILSKNGPAVDVDASDEWAADNPHVLTEERRARVADFINLRNGKSWSGFVASGQFVGKASVTDVAKRLGISDNRRVALLCPNLTWDSAALGRQTAFQSLTEWVLHTVALFEKKPDWYLVLRCHPHEAVWGTRQPVAGLFANRALAENIRIVSPTEPINTYELMDICDLGLVYTSTTGLEMALRGIQVVTAARTHYASKGFTLDPQTSLEYDRTLDSLTAQEGPCRLSDRELELSWCYCYVYYYQWFRTFPWERDDKTLTEWTIGRVLSDEGQQRYKSTFDLLAGQSAQSNRVS